MDNKLKEYVREQARNHVSPNVLRHNLINRGWNKEDIDEAIKKEYSRSGVPFFVGGILLLVIAFLVVLVLSLINKPIVPDFGNDVGNNVGNTSNNIATTTGSNESFSNSSSPCAAVIDSVEKDSCYIDLVKNNFDCDSLDNETEQNFCYRALEYDLLND